MREDKEVHDQVSPTSMYAYGLWSHSMVLKALGDDMYESEGVEIAAKALELTRSLYAEHPQLYQFNLGVLLAQRLEWIDKKLSKCLLDKDLRTLSLDTMNLVVAFSNELKDIIPEGLEIWRDITVRHPPGITYVLDFLTAGAGFNISPSYRPELEVVEKLARSSGMIGQPVTLSMYYGHEGWSAFPGGEDLRAQRRTKRFRDEAS